MTFYRDSASWCPYSQKIWMQLEEKRIPYALKRINMRCYGPKPASFTSMVPSGALPVIELDGQVITESSVISRVLESEFTDDDGYKNLLPYAPGSDDGRRADALMRLERALFSRWMQWITSSWNDASAQSVYCEVLDEVDAELGAGGGYFMGEEFTLVDIAYAPFLERMAASILYYKGVKIEGNGGRWPNVDRGSPPWRRARCTEASRATITPRRTIYRRSWADARKTAKTPRRETPSTAPTACIGVYLSDLSMRLV